MKIRYVEDNDKEFWFTLDKHLSENEFSRKVNDKMGYVLEENGIPLAILRFNLFWDTIPFINLIYVNKEFQYIRIWESVIDLF